MFHSFNFSSMPSPKSTVSDNYRVDWFISTNTFIRADRYISRCTAFPTRLHFNPAKTQTSLNIRAVWSESSQELWVAKDPKRLPTDSEDSDQPARMRRLIWVFTGRTSNFVAGSLYLLKRYTIYMDADTVIVIKYLTNPNLRDIRNVENDTSGARIVTSCNGATKHLPTRACRIWQTLYRWKERQKPWQGGQKLREAFYLILW